MGFLRRLIGGQPASPTPEPTPEPTRQPDQPSAAAAPVDSAPCPHCGMTLDPIPPRRRLCPACRQPIIPRTRADGARVVLREADLPAFEESNREWTLARNAQLEHDEWMEKAAGIVGPAEASAIESELQSKERYSAQDVYWAAANRAVLRALKAGDWTEAGQIYYGMGWTSYEVSGDQEKSSPRTVQLMREGNIATLRGYAANGIQWVDILACDCRVCWRGRKTRLPIADQIADPSIPHADCVEGWCSCDYMGNLQESRARTVRTSRS